MRRAIDEARKSTAEDDRVHPLVGAVLCDEAGNVLATGYRGETEPGRHAEAIALEKATRTGCGLAGSELFVTLEPCTARGLRTDPCADLICAAGIRTVHIGMLDPNPDVREPGVARLRRYGVEVGLFPADLAGEIASMNREFVSLHGGPKVSTG